MKTLQKLFGIATVPDAKVVFFQPPSVPGFGTVQVLKRFYWINQVGDYADLDKVTQKFIGKLIERPRN